MKKIADGAALVFITLVSLLSLVAILGVWQLFSGDVIMKSFETMGMLAVVSFIIMIADHFVQRTESVEHLVQESYVPQMAAEANLFADIRRVSLVLLVVIVAVLALVGVMGIWDVFSGDTLSRSLASIAIVVFMSLINVSICMERENHPLLRNNNGLSSVLVILIIFGAWMMVSLLSHF